MNDYSYHTVSSIINAFQKSVTFPFKKPIGKQCGPRVCSGSTLFASILNSSVKLSMYLQRTTSADNMFRYIFSWHFKG